MGGDGRGWGGEGVHRVDVAHENVAEEIVEIARGAVEWWSKGVDADGILISTVLLGDPHRRRQFHRVDRVRGAPTRRRMSPARTERNKERDARKRKREIDLCQTGHEPRVLVGGLDVHGTVELAVDGVDGAARDVRQTGPAVDERDRLTLFRTLDARTEGEAFAVDRHGVHRDRPAGRRRRRDGDLGRVRDVAVFGIVFADGEVPACGLLAVVGSLERETDQVGRGGVLLKHVGHDGLGGGVLGRAFEGGEAVESESEDAFGALIVCLGDAQEGLVVDLVAAEGYGGVGDVAVRGAEAVGEVHGRVGRAVEPELLAAGDPEIARAGVDDEGKV